MVGMTKRPASPQNGARFVPAGSASWHQDWTLEHLDHLDHLDHAGMGLPLWVAVARDPQRPQDQLLAAVSIRGAGVVEAQAARWGATLRAPRADEARSEAATQLIAYRAGERREFSLQIMLQMEATHASPFERAAWAALCTIPFGETRTYGQQAAMIGRPSAARAVGRANGRNPIPVVVPCHRIIGGDGSLTGFTGGLAIKRWLLTHEGVRLPAPARPEDQLALAL